MTGSMSQFLRLVPIGDVSPGLCKALAGGVSRRLNAPCAVADGALEPAFAHDARRGQYCSTRLLERLREEAGDGDGVVLGVADVDLFMPVLTFVFGEAVLGAGVAVVSLHRLRQGVYGLPDDPGLALSRAEREAVHEVGHAVGLVHCADFTCPMHATRSVEEIDLAAGPLCGGCGARVGDLLHKCS